jgi:hypothetical protein
MRNEIYLYKNTASNRYNTGLTKKHTKITNPSGPRIQSTYCDILFSAHILLNTLERLSVHVWVCHVCRDDKLSTNQSSQLRYVYQSS